MKSRRWLVIATTGMENVAAGVALCGYLWIGTMPYHVTAYQERQLGIGYAVVGASLICAWVTALLSLAVTLSSHQTAQLRRWVFISLAATVIVSLSHSLTVRRRSVRFPERVEDLNKDRLKLPTSLPACFPLNSANLTKLCPSCHRTNALTFV
jgi:hypothetical protein